MPTGTDFLLKPQLERAGVCGGVNWKTGMGRITQGWTIQRLSVVWSVVPSRMMAGESNSHGWYRILNNG